MNDSPRLIDALRTAIAEAPLSELPAIGGAVAALDLEIRLRLATGAPAAETAPADGDRFLDVKEAAAKLGQTPRWCYKHRKELPVAKVPGRLLRFSERRLEAWIKRRSYA